MKEEKPCRFCNNERYVEKDGVIHECVCAALKRIGRDMPRGIRSAKVKRQHAVHPVCRRFEDNVWLVSNWEDAKAFVKILMLTNNGKFIRLTSDLEIKNIYVGSKSRKTVGEGYEGPVYDNVSEFTEPPDLVIVRLNAMAAKNKAAAGALEEALVVRVDYDRPTWVLTDPENPFGPGSVAYSDSVMELIFTRFDRVVVPAINERLNIGEAVFQMENMGASDEDEDPKPKDEDPKKSKKRKRKRPPVDDEEEDENTNGAFMYGSGLDRSKKIRRN